MKRFGTAKKKNESKDGKVFTLAVFETVWSCRENYENKDGKWCIY